MKNKAGLKKSTYFCVHITSVLEDTRAQGFRQAEGPEAPARTNASPCCCWAVVTHACWLQHCHATQKAIRAYPASTAGSEPYGCQLASLHQRGKILQPQPSFDTSYLPSSLARVLGQTGVPGPHPTLSFPRRQASGPSSSPGTTTHRSARQGWLMAWRDGLVPEHPAGCGPEHVCLTRQGPGQTTALLQHAAHPSHALLGADTARPPDGETLPLCPHTLPTRGALWATI